MLEGSAGLDLDLVGSSWAKNRFGVFNDAKRMTKESGFRVFLDKKVKEIKLKLN